MASNAVLNYLNEIERKMSAGIATEHTHRPALQKLIESLDSNIQAVNEPRRIACGAPDILISRKKFTLGYIETKDIGISLNEAAKSEQLKRYFHALENLILTDYLEFRWYVNGELRQVVRAGNFTGEKIRADVSGAEDVAALLHGFLKYKPQTIRHPKELAVRMANLAHMVRDIIVKAFEQNKASDMLKDWRSAFAQTLMHDLERPERTGDFADMFAQTIAYGLFSARVLDPTPDTFSRQEAQALIPKSNPFLRNFFYQITGPALDDEPFAPFVDDLVAVLAHIDMTRVLKDFGVSKKTRDPVFHFYETFLAEYDPALREKRGVYYTPDPVVSYIVRSVDLILKIKFKCPEGLADSSKVKLPNWRPEKRTKKDAMRKTDECHRVLILDPACGTGTFLYDIIGLIRNQFIERNDAGMWPGYVKGSLLPRLFGFELMMAPYAIAHFKLSLQLADRDLLQLQEQSWKYEMEEGNRLNIFLTNTLEDMHEMSGLPLFARWIAAETEAANAVKRDLPIMVICGNPPYSGHSENNGKWISDLINDYKFVAGKPLGEKNSKWLQDDYVKFIRFAQWRLDQSGSGVLAFISNNGYLDNPTFCGMRWSLMQSFNDIYILNLHGLSNVKKQGFDESDENVFDIQQGVCIGIFVKQSDSNRKCQIHYAEIIGRRDKKYARLNRDDVSKTKWIKVSPHDPLYFFIPQDENLRNEYDFGVLLPDIFIKQSMGVATARDELTVAWTADELLQRIRMFSELPAEDARKLFNLGKDARDWKVLFAQQDILQTKCSESLIAEYVYRPFDTRATYYTGKTKGFLCMPRADVMCHLNGKHNKALCFVRRSRENVLSNYFVASSVVDKTLLSSADNANVAPLYLYPNTSEFSFGAEKRKPNLSEKFIKEFSEKLKLKFIPEGQGDCKKTFGPEDVFYYIYAILHSPTYRTRYADFLKIDFPRVPLTSDKKLFAFLVKLGGKLSALHLLEAPELNKPTTAFPVAGNNEVEKGFPKFNVDATSSSRSVQKEKSIGDVASALGCVYINKTQYFAGVPSNVWNFTIGGYQVCEKWLKDRRGRELSHNDLQHYKKIIAALGMTIELMQKIDEIIPAWPIN